MKKDVLAGGYARTAQFIGGVGDGQDLKKVSDEPRFEFTPEPVAAPKRKVFRPAGKTILIRRNVISVSPLLEGVDSVEKEQPNDGEILGVGPFVTNFLVGQTAVFGKYAGTLYPLNGEDLIMAQEEEILGTIEDEVASVDTPFEYYQAASKALDEACNIGVCCSPYGVNGNGNTGGN